MSVAFAELMAMSRTQTQEQQSVLQAQKLDRERRELQARKKREEQERKEAELEKQRRIRHFENLKREEERQKEQLEKESVLEAERQRKEQARLDALRYGPKKAAKGPSIPREKRRDDADETNGPQALTREELRERKRQAEQRRLMAAPKKGFHSHSSHRRPGRRLPGGAIDTTSVLPSTASGSTQTTRERIAAMPPTLIKLNTVKRDLRTIDEIQTQLKNSKAALEGDQARSFDQFFTDRKPKAAGTAPSSRQATPPPPKKSVTPVPVSVPKKIMSRPMSANVSRASSSDRVMSKASKTKPSRPVPSKKRSRSRSASPPPKRRAVSLSEDEYDSYEDDDVGGDYKVGSIYQMLRGGRRDHDNIFSDDEDDMEADARILEKEEKMSARIAQREEAEALAAEKRHEEEKRKKKMALSKHK